MSGTPRFIPPSSTGALVEVTYRTIQGRFLLRPSPELDELVVGVLARAQSFCDAELIGIVVLSNHVHLLLWVPNQWHLSTLMQHFGGNVAREVNRLRDWRGSLWERRYTGIYVTKEPAAQIERLAYSPAPPVHAASKKAREEWREAFGMFLLAYREAAKLLKNGIQDVVFPEGCFPPGLPFVGEVGKPARAPG